MKKNQGWVKSFGKDALGNIYVMTSSSIGPDGKKSKIFLVNV